MIRVVAFLAIVMAALSGCSQDRSDADVGARMLVVGSKEASLLPVRFMSHAIKHPYVADQLEVSVSVIGDGQVVPLGAASLELHGEGGGFIGSFPLAPQPASNGLLFMFRLSPGSVEGSMFLFLFENPRGWENWERPVLFALPVKQIQVLESSP